MPAKETQAVPCQFCDDKPTREKCSTCKKIYKEEMARLLRKEKTIYISERNKGGKKKVNIDRENLILFFQGKSCRETAKALGVSAQTISRLRRKYGIK